MQQTPEEAQPQFPLTNINVTPQGIVITTHVTPVSAFTQVIDLETFKKILPMMKEQIKQQDLQQQTQLSVIRHISGTKNK